MRRFVLVIPLILVLAACGGARRTAAPATTRAASVEKPLTTRPRFEVGVVGKLAVQVTGVRVQRGSLEQVGDEPLVLVSSQVKTPQALAVFARAHPQTHFALVGASTAGNRVRNVVGLVIRDDQASLLAGVVAGLVASGAGGPQAPRVAWVGPEERKLAGAFARGLHQVAPQAVLLRQWSRRVPARCKEAALTAIGRGALAVMAHGGTCADAATAAAHQENIPGLRLGQFELPEVAAELVVRDALGGVYRGDEDIVFGAASGAVGVRALDPRIPLTIAVRARAAAQQLASGLPASG
jgi:hypothetical protein